MKKIKILLLMALASSTFFTSCINDEPLAGADIADGPTIVGFAQSKLTESYFTDIGPVDKNYQVTVISNSTGVPTTKDITVSVAVNATETTATSGGEYNITASTVTIPAGESFVNIPITINTGGLNPTAPTKLVLDLTLSTTDGVVVSAFNKQMVINFVGCKSTIADFNYMVTIDSEGVYPTYGPKLESVTKESVNHFLTYSVGYWNPPLNAGHGIRFEDICGQLIMPSQSLADKYSNTVKPVGTASVQPNGDFTITYTIGLSGNDRKFIATYIKQ